jgi:hypothetical protein
MRTNKIRNSEIFSTRHNHANGVSAWVGLHPVTILTLGTPTQPVEQMMGAQSGLYRLIVALGNIRLPKRIPSIRALFGASLTKPVQN